MNIVNLYWEVCDEKSRKLILEKCDRTAEDFENDVIAIKEWLKYQHHLPKNFSENIIRIYLTLTNCSVELTKSKLDWYFTVRRYFPEIFSDNHPFKTKRLEMGRQMIYFITMPKLSNKVDRIIYTKLKDHNIENYQLKNVISYVVNWMDLSFQFEFTPSIINVVDLQYCRISYIKQITPAHIKAMLKVFEKTLHFKFVGVHLINAPKYIQSFLSFVKPFVKKKLFDRIHVHEDVESLKQIISLECIPKDYGGTAKSFAELEELMSQTITANKAFFDARETWKVNEDLRPQKLSDDLEIFGLSGNFKQLHFD